jgi:ppGpp synthetase/RelA/SpoT-type nucleotidyltranferase
MKLLTKSDRAKLIKQWDKHENATLSSLMVYVKLFSPYKEVRYYLIALNPNDEDEVYAIVKSNDEVDIGYFSMSALGAKNVFGAPIFEREIYSFDPMPAITVFEGLLTGEFYKKGGEVEVKIVNQGEKFDQSKYEAIYGDSDDDGLANIDDKNPFAYDERPEKTEQVEMTKVFGKLLDTKEDLDSTMDDMVIDLKSISPKGAKIYARTKTPYSILKKLIDKKLINKDDPRMGLTDLVGTTIVVDNYNQVLKVKRLIQNGALGQIIDFDDYYKNPKAGYRAFHYIVIDKAKGIPVEVQLKTYRMKEVNMLSHDAYKEERLDSERLLYVTSLANKADRGDVKAQIEFEKLMKDKEKLKKSFYK